ncbi:MAG: histidine phosphatase family protein [bacterium]|nr:histidine phosphatase family protein [bacterium]
MKNIYLIRHGETESNRKGIFRGRLDIPLSPTGRKQAEGLRGYFEKLPVDAVLSSPLQRAVETAQIAFPGHAPLNEEKLDNLDLGDWSGMEKEVVKRTYPGQWEDWITRPESITFPGGESLTDVLGRVSRLLREIVSGTHASVALVSHRSVVKVIIAAAIGLKENYYWKFHLDNASVTQLIHDPHRGFTLVKLNDVAHLEELTVEWY